MNAPHKHGSICPETANIVDHIPAGNFPEKSGNENKRQKYHHQDDKNSEYIYAVDVTDNFSHSAYKKENSRKDEKPVSHL